jgi:hypothetical protein
METAPSGSKRKRERENTIDSGHYVLAATPKGGDSLYVIEFLWCINSDTIQDIR